MSGPSLKKQDAHSSIHEAALSEAIELRDLFEECLIEGENDKAVKVAEVITEHWESRTLKHAESEEEGLYKEIAKENPELQNLVIQLTRDHDLMRKMVEEIKGQLTNNIIDKRLLSLIDSLIIVDSIHNEDEMNKLLGCNER